MSFGMTYDQFWYGDVDMVVAYRKAHEIALDEANELAWIQGAYVYQAIAALAPALKAFAKGRVQPYMKEPIGYEEKRQAEMKKEKKRKEKEERDKAKALLEVWAINFNEKFEKKEQEKLTEKSGESDGGNNDTRN